MFTGIITDIGKITKITDHKAEREFTVQTKFPMLEVKIGASIACDGACMTVTSKTENSFSFTAAAESLRKTTMQDWQEGYEVNLERAVKLGQELDGALVSGHIDDLAEVLNIEEDGQSHKLTIKVGKEYQDFLIEKGTVVLNGVALTINMVEDEIFTVNVIPHSWQHTNLKNLSKNSLINFEADMIAKYIKKQVGRYEQTSN